MAQRHVPKQPFLLVVWLPTEALQSFSGVPADTAMWVLKRCNHGFHRLQIADLAQRRDRGLAHLRFRIAQSGHQRGQCLRLSEPSESPDGPFSHVHIGICDRLNQCRHRLGRTFRCQFADSLLPSGGVF